MGSKKRKIKAMGLAGMLVVGLVAEGLPAESVSAANGWEVPLNATVDTEATVTLTMDASSENGKLNASAAGVNPDAAADVVRRTATVGLTNTGGYTVKIRGDSTNLTGASTSNTIPSVTTATTLGQMTNAWGWNGSIGNTVTDCSLAGTFKQMTTSDQELGSGGAESSATKKVTMCFGARVDGTKAADTYSNTVTLSVVAQPGKVATFNGITQMQQMTPAICKAADINDTAQLEDVRDGKKYWVTKLLDGNCWMSQNLDLNLGSSVIASNDDGTTFVWDNSSAYPPHTTVTTINKTTLGYGANDDTGTYSWDMGNYVIIDPTAMEACGGSTGLNACPEQFADVSGKTASTDPNFYKDNGNKTYTDTEYDAHYLAGNYYQWNAATAGTGRTITNANASGSICPKNWQLPNSGTATGLKGKGSFSYSLSQYGISWNLTGTSESNNLLYNVALSPLFFVRGGTVYTSLSGNFSEIGYRGRYHSSRACDSNSGCAFSLKLDNYLSTSDGGDRDYGYSLRCFFPAS